MLTLSALAQKYEAHGHSQDKWVGTWATAPQETPAKFTPKTTTECGYSDSSWLVQVRLTLMMT